MKNLRAGVELTRRNGRMNMTSKRFKAIFIAILTTIGPMPVYAESYCGGTLVSAVVQDNGSLIVYPNFRNDYLMICNVNGSWGRISSNVCQTWVADAYLAIITQRPITIAWHPTVDCASVPTYSNTPQPWYFRMD